ncbi:MAG: hypothetical protein JXR14_00845 [Paracoccaceae bacterium]
MKFASVDGKRVKPEPKLKGKCPHCGQDTVAKCGSVKVWHWAHKSKRHCDPWWEPETEWHRRWKEQFPEEWQEIGRRDKTGELHVADILTPEGMVLEFQHSHIDREEVEKRTNFHKNICWVIDGLRLKTSLPQFDDALRYGIRRPSGNVPVFELFLSHSRLLRKWSGLNAPITIDFGGDAIWVIGANLERSVLVYAIHRSNLVEQFKASNIPPAVEVRYNQRTVSTGYRGPVRGMRDRI